jgi:hypothetical protein
MSGATMRERLRGNHALSWTAIGVLGAAVVVACFLAGFEIAIEAYIGAGDAQRGFRYERELTLAGDLRPLGLLPLAGGAALVAAGIAGVVLGSRTWLVVASFVVAVALALLVFDLEDRRLEGWSDSGVIGYESPHGGPLLQPALDELNADARASSEARQPGWTLLGGEHGFRARGLEGWQLFLRSALALLWLTGYRLARLHFRPWASIWLVLGATAAILVWLVLRALSGLE